MKKLLILIPVLTITFSTIIPMNAPVRGKIPPIMRRIDNRELIGIIQIGLVTDADLHQIQQFITQLTALTALDLAALNARFSNEKNILDYIIKKQAEADPDDFDSYDEIIAMLKEKGAQRTQVPTHKL